uniref:Thiamine biosynthesis protein ThiS n=1 Tax=uncultured Verrucomicrobiota bacterium TaxID=156588 RepID=D2DXT5_9BACT|nr:thiamine biosynthesis protein ThiS [uncultured Verrucomicrobiota bacterium]
MTLLVNGESRELSARDVAELVVALGMPPATLLVEHNGLALRRDEWTAHALSDGDRLEIIRIVAGG